MAEARIVRARREARQRRRAPHWSQRSQPARRKDKRAFKDVVRRICAVKAHFNAAELERLFMPTDYQGSAQTFIDRLVASAQGRAVRRSSSVSRI